MSWACISSFSLENSHYPLGGGGSPLDGCNLRVERERSRICLVLTPDSLAVGRSLNGKTKAEGKYENPCEQSQKPEDNNRSSVMLLTSSKWIH